MKRDRYVALTPRREEGKLLTRTFRIPGDRLTINTNAAAGEVRVRLLDENSRPLDAAGDSFASAVRGDGIAENVHWQQPLSRARNKVVRLEIAVRNASIYGIEFHAAPS